MGLHKLCSYQQVYLEIFNYFETVVVGIIIKGHGQNYRSYYGECSIMGRKESFFRVRRRGARVEGQGIIEHFVYNVGTGAGI